MAVKEEDEDKDSVDDFIAGKTISKSPSPYKLTVGYSPGQQSSKDIVENGGETPGKSSQDKRAAYRRSQTNTNDKIQARNLNILTLVPTDPSEHTNNSPTGAIKDWSNYKIERSDLIPYMSKSFIDNQPQPLE